MEHSFKSQANRWYPRVIEHYRHLHRYPELSHHESQTSAYVCEVLTQLGIPYRRNIGGHGVLGRIEPVAPSDRCIALRADMDALPIQEETGLEYASTVPRVMHACGHDAHTACLLGVAGLLMESRELLDGTVLLIFQPAEEKAPGGAGLMLRDGLLDGYKPEAIIGQHVHVDLPCGHVSMGEGTVMASADEIHLTVRGKGGHGALPHLCNDTVLAAAQIVAAVQQVVSRRVHPFDSAVVTFGRFIADGSTNIIPDEVDLSGTMRCMNPTTRRQLREQIPGIIRHTAAAYGCDVEVRLPEGYPPVLNNEELARRAMACASRWLGPEKVHRLEPRMTSEDFGYYSELHPSLFYRFGIRGQTNRHATGIHTSRFFIDEEGLLTGLEVMASLACELLSRQETV